MPLPAKFANKKPATTNKPKSKYSGVKSIQPRDPMPVAGKYRFQVLEIEEGYNKGNDTTSHKVKLAIAAGANERHAIGDVVTAAWVTSGKSATNNLRRVKAFTMAAGGFETDDEYDVFDPDGLFIDATAGSENDYSALTLVGRYVDCNVTRGNDVLSKDTGVPTGDYYREYAWSVVPEEEQDTTASVLTQMG
jgi:hypothetical protein